MKQYVIISWEGKKLISSQKNKVAEYFHNLTGIESIDVFELNEKEILFQAINTSNIIHTDEIVKKDADLVEKYKVYTTELVGWITKLRDKMSCDVTPETNFSIYELCLYRKIAACKTTEEVQYLKSLIKNLYFAVTDKDETRRNYIIGYLKKLGYRSSDIIALYNDSCKITISSDYE